MAWPRARRPTRRCSGRSLPERANDSLDDAEEKLRAHGGRITEDVDDSSLTHIIMDDADSGRYVELLRRTSKPKLKHIVLPSWVNESLDEDTLMDEDCELRCEKELTCSTQAKVD